MTWMELKNLSKSYGGVHALRNVSLTLEPGEVHALCGENGAGKSTLIKLLAGLIQPDSGQIVLNGQRLRIPNVRASENAGIAVMHQESTAFPDLNTVDNIFVGREITRAGGLLLDRRAMQQRSRQLLERLGESFPIDCPVRELSLAQRQMVALARALSLECRLLIMDEPTASLSERETLQLKTVVRELRTAGISILYVSHRLEEVFQLSDRITVFRDGELISSRKTSDCTRDTLIHDMVGRELAMVSRQHRIPPSAPAVPDRHEDICEPTLKVRGLSSRGRFENINLELAPGQILGLAGLVGSGRSEIARAIAGIDGCDSGMITIGGKSFGQWTVQDTIQQGLALVPEDRQLEGLVLEMSVRENFRLTNLDQVTKHGIIRDSLANPILDKQLQDLRIKLPGPDFSVSSLSGGNQQKVVIGKWLARHPKVLILDEPTRGVDVGAKEQIYRIIEELVARGMSILLISSELAELLRLSDDVAIVRNGRIVAQFRAGEKSQEEILALSLPDTDDPILSESDGSEIDMVVGTSNSGVSAG